MATEMSQFKSTANAHMRRDMESLGKWTCDCEACVGIRSLMGMEKALEVRPLVRKIEELSAQLGEMPRGAEKDSLLEQYLTLYDELASVVAK